MDGLSENAAESAPQVDGVILLEGEVLTPLRISIEALSGFESVEAAPFALRCFTTNRFLRDVGRYRGVLLRDLILRAGLRNASPTDFKRTVFVAVAHDGYAVTFSWHELFNTAIGEQALVAYECDGKPLSVDDGAPVLFSGADILPAPRHIKRLARVRACVLSI